MVRIKFLIELEAKTLETSICWIIYLGFPFHKRTLNLGRFYTRSQGWKNLGPTLSILGLLFGPKLLINARTLINK
jgi:hypothetical protein